MSLYSCSNVNCVVLPSHVMDLAESAGIDSMHLYGEKLVVRHTFVLFKLSHSCNYLLLLGDYASF